MTIIVEDGTGVPNAVSYITVAQADAYHLARAATLWATMTDPEKEGCLVRATDFMIQRYRMSWLGRRTYINQALDWPRAGVVLPDFKTSFPGAYGVFAIGINTIPNEVKNACAELALRASIGTLSEDKAPRVLQETIGPITIKYDQYSSQLVTYTQVEGILAPLLSIRSQGAMVKLTRC